MPAIKNKTFLFKKYLIKIHVIELFYSYSDKTKNNGRMKISAETHSFNFKVTAFLFMTLMSGIGYKYNDDKKQFTARDSRIVEQLATQNKHIIEQFERLHQDNKELEKKVVKIDQNVSTLNEAVSMLKSIQLSQIPRKK